MPCLPSSRAPRCGARRSGSAAEPRVAAALFRHGAARSAAGDAEAARRRSCAEDEGARRFAVRALGLAVWFHTCARVARAARAARVRVARVARARAVPSLGSCERAGPAGGALSIRP